MSVGGQAARAAAQVRDELRHTAPWCVHHALTDPLHQQHRRQVQRHRRVTLSAQLLAQRSTVVEHQLAAHSTGGRG